MGLYTHLSGQTNSSAVIAPELNLKVFYIGIDNPVAIAVPGIANDKLFVTIKNGTLTKSDGKYIVKVSETGNAIIEVGGEIKPDEIKHFSSDTFRIKKIPNPVVCFGNNCSSNIYMSKEDILKNPTLYINWIMPLDMEFKIVSFTFSYISNGSLIETKVTGDTFTEKITEVIKKMETGSKFYLENIKATGPYNNKAIANETRSFAAITVKIVE